MFKKFLLLITFGLSCQALWSVKIQTGSNNTNHEFIADGGEFELSATELNHLKSALIDGIIEDTGIIGRDTIPLPINKQTFALLKTMLSNTPEFDPERAENILCESTVTEFLPLFHALCFLNTTNTELCRVVAEHYLAIQSQIAFDNIAQHAQYITLFFQQDCVKELLANTAATHTLLQTFNGHTSLVHSVAFSPDGTKIATGSWDNTARLWDINTGQCLQTFTGHEDTVCSVIFSPDGTKLATGSSDHTAKLWDVTTSQCLQTLTGHTGWIRSVAFSPDGTKLATGSEDRTARLWDINTGQCLHTLNGHTKWVRSVAFSLDGTKLTTGSWDHTTKLWNIRTGKCFQTFSEDADAIVSVTFSPDGTKLATGSDDGTAKLWAVNTSQCLQTLNGHTNSIYSIVFSPDGTKLATGSSDHTTKLWDVNTGQCLHTLTGHANWVLSVAFSPDGTKLATGSSDGIAKLWAILDTAQQVLLVWAMKNTGKFTIGVLPFLDEVYASLPEQLKEKIMTTTGV